MKPPKVSTWESFSDLMQVYTKRKHKFQTIYQELKLQEDQYLIFTFLSGYLKSHLITINCTNHAKFTLSAKSIISVV